ncbi:molybdenum cofactor biosynthesis protein MoaE [Candidatus Acetothermia bacterium]|jgi:molybdopterin synthase catalytic subunit|nr:molybdenum cofactor biosynthesis protein MoaE [Candidatus Acetothermia bacterium]MCI2432296.1 molybdenum cofactor biosynthesis protein MoaE [Candidatus Acetothermia bacterium]MCI2437421.1 molybdenum cofactor biosynthesis protein MoaE [Candidatus Acetothermia bacterium]
MYIEITARPISLEEALVRLDLTGRGGLVTFSGIARPTDAQGQKLSHLEYEAYTEMAHSEIEKIGREIEHRWGVTQIAILHRVGRVEIGEPSVIIAVAAEHRAEAFAACRYAIDTLKKTVPIWKRERYSHC